MDAGSAQGPVPARGASNRLAIEPDAACCLRPGLNLESEAAPQRVDAALAVQRLAEAGSG
jgi:hypothetical protein